MVMIVLEYLKFLPIDMKFILIFDNYLLDK